MGRELDDEGLRNYAAAAAATTAMRSPIPLESRPGIFVIGPPNVGKRTLLSRLLSADFSDEPDSFTGILCHGWNIDTKYYTADVSIWTAQLDEGFSPGMLPVPDQLAALVMVLDMSDATSFVAIQNWVLGMDIQHFEILLCIGNKVDLLPGHFGHVEYRRRLQNQGESVGDPHPEFLDYGISETEGSSLLGEEEPYWEMRRSCLEWCSQYDIEFVEACASNADFDKCLSIDGDMQGVERLFGALSAHMWPGMVLKTGDKIMKPSLIEKEAYSDEESEYEFEYERLSAASDEPWGSTSDSWVSFSDQIVRTSMGERSPDRDLNGAHLKEPKQENEVHISNSACTGRALEVPDALQAEIGTENTAACENSHLYGSDHEHEVSESIGTENTGACEKSRLYDSDHEYELSESSKGHASTSEDTVHENDVVAESTKGDEFSEDSHFTFDNLEQLMSEIGNMRDNLRLMPDFQRREMAAKLAMKMAVMFGESSDEDGYE